MLKAIIFDVDGVLLDSTETNWRYISSIAQKFNQAPPTWEDFVDNLSFLSRKHALRYIFPSKSDEEIEYIWVETKDRTKYPYPFELLRIDETLPEILASLSEKYKLGIASSRVKAIFSEYEPLMRLLPLFQSIVMFEDVQRTKPDPEALHLSLEKLGVTAEEAIYIGDAQTDMLAAEAAGIRGVFFGTENKFGADYHFSKWKDLPALINSLS